MSIIAIKVPICKGYKWCNGCKLPWPEKNFVKSRTSTDGLATQCKSCTSSYMKKRYERDKERINAKSKEWRLANPERNNRTKYRYKLKSKYGITEEKYKELIQKQNGLCANTNCNNLLTDVDHCHKTGIVRGLLCKSCNLTLGFVKDDVDLLQGLINYLNGD